MNLIFESWPQMRDEQIGQQRVQRLEPRGVEPVGQNERGQNHQRSEKPIRRHNANKPSQYERTGRAGLPESRSGRVHHDKAADDEKHVDADVPGQTFQIPERRRRIEPLRFVKAMLNEHRQRSERAHGLHRFETSRDFGFRRRAVA